jgi:hypothetical protein
MASHTTKPLRDLLGYMDREELVLPEIQRDFVWTRRNVLKLFDSLYRQMPIGHLLVWKAREAVETKGFKNTPRPQSPHQLDNFFGYLLDGQQRLTAIARVRVNDGDYPLHFCFRPGRSDDEGEIFSWAIPRGKESVWYIPVFDLLKEPFNLVQFIDELRAQRAVTSEDAERVRKELEKVRGVLDYQVGITIFEGADYSDATELFIRFNSTGRRLRKTDLNMAELAKKVPGIASGEIAAAQKKWPGFPFTAPFIIQCLLAIEVGRLQIQNPRDAWANVSEESIRRNWSQLERALDQVTTFLTATVRWKRLSSLPSINALIPLIVVLAKGASFDLKDRELARRWLHMTTIRYLFSGSVYTTIDKILKKLDGKASVSALWNATPKSTLKSLKWDDFDVSRVDGPAMGLVTAMLSTEDARDWKELDRRLDGSVVGKEAQLHVHHFFPRALLRKHDYADDWINVVTNYVILSASTNFDVGMEEPDTYMDRLNVPARQLELQCIPTDRELWRVKNYEKFLAAREKLLVHRGDQYLGL